MTAPPRTEHVRQWTVVIADQPARAIRSRPHFDDLVAGQRPCPAPPGDCHLSVKRIQLAIGGFAGALQAYQWRLAHPDLVERIAPCCGAAGVCRLCYVFLTSAKATLCVDQTWVSGDHNSPPVEGMKAMGRVWAGWALSRRSHRDKRFEGRSFKSVDDFLVAFWEAFWLSLDATNPLRELNTWLLVDISMTAG